MPSKIQLDENLWFLYICLQKSDYKTIDFNAVGEATNLKSPAARMRYTRLRRQIEDGTLTGTHGLPFSGGAEKIAEAMKRRRKSTPNEQDEIKGSVIQKYDEAPDPSDLKFEPSHMTHDPVDRLLNDSDSEDEVPLAKRRSRIRRSVQGPSQMGYISGLPETLKNWTVSGENLPSVPARGLNEDHRRRSYIGAEESVRHFNGAMGTTDQFIPNLQYLGPFQHSQYQIMSPSHAFPFNTRVDDGGMPIKLEKYPEVLEDTNSNFYKVEGNEY